MITSLLLKFGSAPGAVGVPIPMTPVTVFVGPNNAGKSKVLAEIRQFCNNGATDMNASLLQALQFAPMSDGEAQAALDLMAEAPAPGEFLHHGQQLFQGRYGRYQIDTQRLKNALARPNEEPGTFCNYFLHHHTLILDGINRLGLVNPQPAGDLQRRPVSSLQVLFRDDAKRHEVRRIVREAIGTNFVIDPTSLGNFRVRLSSRPPRDDKEERGIDADAVSFHEQAQLIDQASDGVKAFIGIVAELIAGDPRVLLIDEPEAFLHPPLASKLGHEISRAAVTSQKSVFVSTHSPWFVMGCIQSGVPVNIIRLSYREGVGTARLLESTEMLELMRNPLLRSTGVLSGLFYESAVVTESDADRAFYQEVNERLLRFSPDRGIPNCLFLNAQNKQTVQTIIKPLRRLGIPAAGIVDVDVMKDGGTNWTNLLSAAGAPPISSAALAGMRAELNRAMVASGRDMKREGGIAILGGEQLEAAQSLLRQLAEYGVFVVPVGELESWLQNLGKGRGHGPAWLIDVFERMGSDPAAPGYVMPRDDDVWQFLAAIKGWLGDPRRRGIPN